MLVNATTLVVGGGIQVGVGFLEHALSPAGSGIRLHCLVPPQIRSALPAALRDDPRIEVVSPTPARPFGGRASRRTIRRAEAVFAPDVVYSLGFPSYVRFAVPEIGRYTNPWEIFPARAAWTTIPRRRRPALALKIRYRRAWARRAAYYETQTTSAKQAIARTFGLSERRIHVFPNAPHPRFVSAAPVPIPGTRRIFCLAAEHHHKNLAFVPAVAAELAARGFGDARFVLTLPASSPLLAAVLAGAARHQVLPMIENAGPLSLDDCLRHYREADAVFLPTLLEVFSATYPEAMAMGRPIVTSELDFAREICGSAAMYYDPLDASAAAGALEAVLTDGALRDALVERGRRRFLEFPDPQEKHRLVLEWLAAVAADARKSRS